MKNMIYTNIKHHIKGLTIKIEVEVHTVYKTGVEVEAMHAAAITALTLYDMLKPIDKSIEISNIRLESKTGGKSDINSSLSAARSCVVIVCSDSISSGINQDTSGKILAQKLEESNCVIESLDVIPDEVEVIRQTAIKYSNNGIDLMIFVGGTGLSPRDVTPEAIKPLIQTEIPGVMERLRNYGQDRMPFAMFSRGVAGFIKDTLVITLPGSTGAVKDACQALFPHIFHVFKVRNGDRHDQNNS